MNKGVFPVIADFGAGGKGHQDYIDKVIRFFGPNVDEGMRILKAQARAQDAGENPESAADSKEKGADDDDDEDDEGFS